jgi:hypothetical protein
MELVQFDVYGDVKKKILEYWWKLTLLWEGSIVWYKERGMVYENQYRLNYSYYYLFPSFKIHDVRQVRKKCLYHFLNPNAQPKFTQEELLPLLLVKNIR